MQRFRGGLVFKAHRLVYHSTLGLRVIKKKKGANRGVEAVMPEDRNVWVRGLGVDQIEELELLRNLQTTRLGERR